MFVRLKKRKQCKADLAANDTSYSIVAVESFWDEQGKPRQKFLKHLGTIKESQLRKPSAYNEYINEIMKYVFSTSKGYVTDIGYIDIKRDEFKKLIYAAFVNVGTRLDFNVGTMLEIMAKPTVGDEFTRKAAKTVNTSIESVRLAEYIQQNGIPAIEEACFNGKITLEEAFPIVIKPKAQQEQLLLSLLQSNIVGTRLMNDKA